MELIDAIKARRSIRKFKSTPVPDSTIREILDAGRLAPSGSNLQPARYIVVKSQDVRTKLRDCTPLPFVADAPVVIACCVDTKALGSSANRYRELKEAGAFIDTPLDDPKSPIQPRKKDLDAASATAYLSLNVAIAIDHITLRATDLGFGTCWIMMFDQEKTKEALGLDERYNVVALLPVGFPDQAPDPRPRLALNEILLKEI
ncbi:putative NAD(P)H nitroreductase [bioreactor metagenome]|uniref:Putative NAD(P)H nitroreductase n=1 Tax=bioreactor metagenome TaxID=1076179 RepID=A0A645BIH2_9ZZZZ